MPIPIPIILAGAIKYGPTAVSMIQTGIKIGKALAEGRNELTDEEWAEVILEGDQTGQDFRDLVGRE
ncbi:MAG: hypothetical protein ACE5G5_14055 [Candidatus Methylomirabilales bacterium]